MWKQQILCVVLMSIWMEPFLSLICWNWADCTLPTGRNILVFPVVKSLWWQLHHLLFYFARFNPYFIMPPAVLNLIKPQEQFYHDNTKMTVHIIITCLLLLKCCCNALLPSDRLSVWKYQTAHRCLEVILRKCLGKKNTITQHEVQGSRICAIFMILQRVICFTIHSKGRR